MVEIAVTLNDAGEVYVRLSPDESSIVRDSVSLGDLDEADRIPTLDALTLDFDHYGRLAGIRVAGSPDSVLAPALVDAARRG